MSAKVSLDFYNFSFNFLLTFFFFWAKRDADQTLLFFFSFFICWGRITPFFLGPYCITLPIPCDYLYFKVCTNLHVTFINV